MVVGKDLREAVFQAIYTEINAGRRPQALALGAPVFLTEEEAAACATAVSISIDRAWSLWMDQS
jgi:hypothetical protein